MKQCLICKDHFELNYIKLDCNHAYCTECFKSWFKSNKHACCYCFKNFTTFKEVKESKFQELYTKNELPDAYEIGLLKKDYEKLQEENEELNDEIDILINQNEEKDIRINTLNWLLEGVKNELDELLPEAIKINRKKIVDELLIEFRHKCQLTTYYVILERVKDNNPNLDNQDYNCINIQNISCYDSNDSKIEDVSIHHYSSQAKHDSYSPTNVLNDSSSIFHTCYTDFKPFITLKVKSLNLKSVDIKNRNCCKKRLVGCRVRILNERQDELFVSKPFDENTIEIAEKTNNDIIKIYI